MTDIAEHHAIVPSEVVSAGEGTTAAPAPMATHSAIVEAIDPEVARDHLIRYQNLCHALLTPDDVMTIQGKQFKKKSAWRKLAFAFNVSDEVMDRSYERDPETGRILRAEVVVRATAPNGRYMEGIGACDLFEKCNRRCPEDCNGARHFSNPQHDIPATAHTRAVNRACADLFGLGEVSAEEMNRGRETDHEWDDEGGYAHGDNVPNTRRARQQPPAQVTDDEPATDEELEAMRRQAMMEANALPNEHRAPFTTCSIKALKKWMMDNHLPHPASANGAQLKALLIQVGLFATKSEEKGWPYRDRLQALQGEAPTEPTEPQDPSSAPEVPAEPPTAPEGAEGVTVATLKQNLAEGVAHHIEDVEAGRALDAAVSLDEPTLDAIETEAQVNELFPDHPKLVQRALQFSLSTTECNNERLTLLLRRYKLSMRGPSEMKRHRLAAGLTRAWLEGDNTARELLGPVRDLPPDPDDF